MQSTPSLLKPLSLLVDRAENYTRAAVLDGHGPNKHLIICDLELVSVAMGLASLITCFCTRSCCSSPCKDQRLHVLAATVSILTVQKLRCICNTDPSTSNCSHRPYFPPRPAFFLSVHDSLVSKDQVSSCRRLICKHDVLRTVRFILSVAFSRLLRNRRVRFARSRWLGLSTCNCHCS